jgi:hypothetical protein
MAVSTIDPNGLNVGQFGNRNVIINGNFDVWQRGISQTSSAYGSDDRWSNLNSGSTKVASQQGFTLGQTDVVGNPKYYSRTVVTSVAGAGNYVLKRQSVEGVTTFSGETVSFTFWAKADANKNIAVEFYQNFGSGGSPSGLVFLPSQTVSLTTSWAKHSLTFDIPSVSGKTLGTDGNDSLSFHFWFEAGSDYNSRTNSLGQQSGTFDIAQVQLEVGDTATPFEHRSYGQELALCQRYYEQLSGNNGEMISGVGQAFTSSSGETAVIYKVEKRAAPTITTSGNFQIWLGSQSANPTSNSFFEVRTTQATWGYGGATAGSTGQAIQFYADGGLSSIKIDAEL